MYMYTHGTINVYSGNICLPNVTCIMEISVKYEEKRYKIGHRHVSMPLYFSDVLYVPILLCVPDKHEESGRETRGSGRQSYSS